ncbi:MAG: lipoate--protein ligase family protein [Spirochaetales bacterium]|nr:lipoate--protein ligase family protein [Spirochaetales bacterium]
MKTNRAVILAQETDPWRNLAAEEALWQNLPERGFYLFLYRNSGCVVLGRHQNPLREVRLGEAGARGIPILRRASGGGTVWHDEGNLNFSFLVDQRDYDRHVVQDFLVRTLGRAGFQVVLGTKGDLVVPSDEGLCKVSGNAYAFRNGKVLHHGTLLCRADLESLRGLLGSTGELVAWVGTPSRPMGVANLGVDPRHAAEMLAEAFEQEFGAVRRERPEEAAGVEAADWSAAVSVNCRRLSSAEWTWDSTPPFTWKGETLQGFREVRVAEGRVLDGSFPSDEGKLFFSDLFFEYLPKRV